jgi:hypothetical protein
MITDSTIFCSVGTLYRLKTGFSGILNVFMIFLENYKNLCYNSFVCRLLLLVLLIPISWGQNIFWPINIPFDGTIQYFNLARLPTNEVILTPFTNTGTVTLPTINSTETMWLAPTPSYLVDPYVGWQLWCIGSTNGDNSSMNNWIPTMYSETRTSIYYTGITIPGTNTPATLPTTIVFQPRNIILNSNTAAAIPPYWLTQRKECNNGPGLIFPPSSLDPVINEVRISVQLWVLHS